jgi:pimeloyl-ACP methyl ester carboxylesterase
MTLRRPVGRVLAAWALTTLVVLLVCPVGLRIEAGVTGLQFLVEFLTEGEHPWLSRVTPPPVVALLGLPGEPDAVPADLWHPGGLSRGPWPGLVLVHGLTLEGKRDARVAWTADRLARAGFAVVVPDLPALQTARLRPDDAQIVRDALERLGRHPAVRRGTVAIIAVSVGLAPVALALDEPGLADRVRMVVTLGGHADARELVRYFTTGAYAFGSIAGRVGVHPALTNAFLARNLDLVPDAQDRAAVEAALEGGASAAAGPGARAVLALLRNREPAQVDALLDALPIETRTLLDAMSPARHLGRTRARLLAIHGRDDPAIPFTESLRLVAAAPERSRLVLVGLIGHVEGQRPAGHRVADFGRLWGVCYELLAG